MTDTESLLNMFLALSADHAEEGRTSARNDVFVGEARTFEACVALAKRSHAAGLFSDAAYFAGYASEISS